MITDKLSNSEYHALESISKSGLDRIAKSPAHFKAGFQGIGADTARIGTAVHSRILEGSKDMIVAPDMPRRSAADKQRWDDWFLENGASEPIAAVLKADEQLPEFQRQSGLTVVTQSEKDAIDQMQESVMSNVLAASILEAGVAEQSILFNHNDVDCRVRPDWINPDHIIADVKSCVDASEHGFRKSCSKFRYHVQDAMYSQGYSAETGVWPRFVFIAVEKTAPYLCAVYELDAAAKENGHWLFERDLETYRECKDSGNWYGYENNFELSIPLWEKPEIVENYGDLML